MRKNDTVISKKHILIRAAACLLVAVLFFCSGLAPASTQAASAKNLKKAKIVLEYSTTVYNGKAKVPAVSVKYGTKNLKKNRDYTVTYKHNENVGTATVVVKGKGKYKGAVKKHFKILPKGTKITNLIGSESESRINVTWKQAKQVDGYQVQCSVAKDFSQTVTGTVKGSCTVSDTFSYLEKGKTYYFHIRTYKVVNGKTFYSKWSKVKTCAIPKKDDGKHKHTWIKKTEKRTRRYKTFDEYRSVGERCTGCAEILGDIPSRDLKTIHYDFCGRNAYSASLVITTPGVLKEKKYDHAYRYCTGCGKREEIGTIDDGIPQHTHKWSDECSQRGLANSVYMVTTRTKSYAVTEDRPYTCSACGMDITEYVTGNVTTEKMAELMQHFGRDGGHQTGGSIVTGTKTYQAAYAAPCQQCEICGVYRIRPNWEEDMLCWHKWDSSFQ